MMNRLQPFSTVFNFAGPVSRLSVFCLLGALIFFWGGSRSNARPSNDVAPATQVTATPVPYQTVDIKDVQIGERLLGKNPIAAEVDDFVPEIHPREWRLLYLTMEKGNGKRLDMQFLRPLEWMKANGAQLGATIISISPSLVRKAPPKWFRSKPARRSDRGRAMLSPENSSTNQTAT